MPAASLRPLVANPDAMYEPPPLAYQALHPAGTKASGLETFQAFPGMAFRYLPNKPSVYPFFCRRTANEWLCTLSMSQCMAPHVELVVLIL